MKPKIVIIEWIDSTMLIPIWYKPQDVPDEPNEVFHTVGYLIKKTKKYHIVCASIHYDQGEIASYGGVFKIPNGCIIKIKTP